MTYKFKSSITKNALNTGVTHSNHVSRDEVPAILNRILEEAKKVQWVYTFASCRIDSETFWKIDSVIDMFNDLQSDILELKAIMEVKE